MRRALFILAIVLAGCAAVTAEQHFAAVGTGLAAARAGIQDAQGGIAAAMPHSDDVGKGILDGSTRALAGSVGNINQASAGEVLAKQAFDSLTKDRDKLANSIGWRAECFIINLGWIALAIAIVLIIVVPVLWAFFGADISTFGTILRTLHAALPVQNLGQILKSWIPVKTAIPPITAGSAAKGKSLFLDTAANAGTIAGG